MYSGSWPKSQLEKWNTLFHFVSMAAPNTEEHKEDPHLQNDYICSEATGIWGELGC